MKRFQRGQIKRKPKLRYWERPSEDSAIKRILKQTRYDPRLLEDISDEITNMHQHRGSFSEQDMIDWMIKRLK